jgi:hypothetical protein
LAVVDPMYPAPPVTRTFMADDPNACAV